MQKRRQQAGKTIPLVEIAAARELVRRELAQRKGGK
jgi:hypothetical protein